MLGPLLGRCSNLVRLEPELLEGCSSGQTSVVIPSRCKRLCGSLMPGANLAEAHPARDQSLDLVPVDLGGHIDVTGERTRLSMS